MLSAVAARKAAQAAKTTAASQPPPSSSQNTDVPHNDSDSDSGDLRMLLRPDKSKRKSSELASPDATVTRKKPRKKIVRTYATKSRYYESESRNEKTPKEMESLSSGSDSDEDVGNAQLVGKGPTSIPRPQQPRKSQRAWSPSNPPFNSSDEQDYSTPGPSLHTDVDSGYRTIQPLSLVPRPEKNVFYLDSPSHSFLSGRKGTIVGLAENETMALLGVYSVTVLRGAISLLGTEVFSSISKSYTVFAPKCSPIPVIAALPSGNHPSVSLPDIVEEAVSPTSTILLLEDVFTGVEGLGRVCKTFEHAFEAPSFSDAVLKLSTAKLVTSLSRSLQPFYFSDSWRAAFSSVPSLSPNKSDDEDDIQSLESLTLLVRGQKRTGKSTLSRTLVNRLLCRYRRVAFLECDVGQTEFTPPGLVSLQLVDKPIFGPPFTHPRLPYASHFIGATSPHNDPAYYVSAISALIQTYKLELQYPAPEVGAWNSDEDDGRISDFVPLVVNTMGWIKGLGADLARQIEESVEPTHVFSTSSSGANGASPTKQPTPSLVTSVGDAPRIFEVEATSSGPQASRYSAADWRTLSMMSYFHSVPSPVQHELLPANIRPSCHIAYNNCAPVCTWHCRQPLMNQEPFAVAPAEAIDNVILLGAGAEDVVPSEIARVLNGSLVALVSCQPGTLDAYDSDYPVQPFRLPYVQGARPPDPSMSNCIGLALVRGVSPSLSDPSTESQETNTEKDVLHLLTPLPPALIAVSEARCLVKGDIELPVWGMLDYRELERRGNRTSEVVSVPYLQWSKGGAIGAERRRVRRNIMRRGQM